MQVRLHPETRPTLRHCVDGVHPAGKLLTVQFNYVNTPETPSRDTLRAHRKDRDSECQHFQRKEKVLSGHITNCTQSR